MNFSDLPNDILLTVIDEMNDNIMPISIVNKEIYKLSAPLLEQEKRRIYRKRDFFLMCSTITPPNRYNFFGNGFNGVTTTEECGFLREEFNIKFSDLDFISRVRYTMANSYQVAAETWARYLMENPSLPTTRNMVPNEI